MHVYWWWGTDPNVAPAQQQNNSTPPPPQPTHAVSPTLVRLVSIGRPRIVYNGSMGWVDSNTAAVDKDVVVISLKDVDLSALDVETKAKTHTIILIATTNNAIKALAAAYGKNWTRWPSLYVCSVEAVVPVVIEAVATKLRSWLLPMSSAGRYKRFQAVKKAKEGPQGEYAKKATILWQLLGTDPGDFNTRVETSNVSPFLTQDSTVLPRALMVSETMYKAVQEQSLLAAVSNNEDLARNVGIVLTRSKASIFKGRGNVPPVCSIVLNLLDPPRTLIIGDTVEPRMLASGSADPKVKLPHSNDAIPDQDVQNPRSLGYVMVASSIITPAAVSAAVSPAGAYIDAVNAYLGNVCSAPGTTFTAGTEANSSVDRVFVCNDVSGTLMAVDAARLVSLAEFPFQGCFVDTAGNLYVHIDALDDLDPSVSFVDHGWVVRRDGVDDSAFVTRFKSATTPISPADRNNMVTQQVRAFNVITPMGTKRGLAVNVAILDINGSKKLRVDKKVSVPGVLEISADKRFLYTNQDAEYNLLGLTADQINAVPPAGVAATCFPTKNTEPATLYSTIMANTRNLLSVFAPPETQAIVINGGALVKARLFKQDDARSKHNFVYGNAVVDIFGIRAYETVNFLYNTDGSLKANALSPFYAPAVEPGYTSAVAAETAIVGALMQLSAIAATISTERTNGLRVPSTGVLEAMDVDALKTLATDVHALAATITQAMATLRSFSEQVRALYVPALPDSGMLTNYEQIALRSLKSDPSSTETSYALGTPEQIQGIRSMVEWLETVELFT